MFIFPSWFFAALFFLFSTVGLCENLLVDMQFVLSSLAVFGEIL